MGGDSRVVTTDADYAGRPRVQPDVVSQHYTQVDGHEVIARQLATSPHPRWKDQHPQTHHFVTELLLADNTSRYECNHCHLVDPNLRSITGHQSKHRPNPPKPITDLDTIKTVLREVERARRLYGANRYAKYAVEALTRLGVQSASGGEWTATKVTSLWQTYKDRYPVRAPKVQHHPKPKTTRRVAAAQPAAHTDNGVVVAPPIETLLPAIGSEGSTLRNLRSHLQAAVVLVDELLNAPPAPLVIDQELADKAQKYDELVKRLLG